MTSKNLGLMVEVLGYEVWCKGVKNNTLPKPKYKDKERDMCMCLNQNLNPHK